MAVKVTIAATKALGWDYLKMSGKTFKGAVKELKGTGELVSVLFTPTHAYIITDDEGNYFTNDYKSILERPDSNVKDPHDIEGTEILAGVEEGEVYFTEAFDKLGLNLFDISEDVRTRLEYLNQYIETQAV